MKADGQKPVNTMDGVGLGIGTDLEKFVVIQNSETFLIGWVPAVSSFLFVPLDHKSQVLSRWRECYFGTAASMRLPAEMEHQCLDLRNRWTIGHRAPNERTIDVDASPSTYWSSHATHAPVVPKKLVSLKTCHE